MKDSTTVVQFKLAFRKENMYYSEVTGSANFEQVWTFLLTLLVGILLVGEFTFLYFCNLICQCTDVPKGASEI